MNVNHQKEKKWDNVRSKSYYVIDIRTLSKDDNCIDKIKMESCPICYNILWHDLDNFKCKICKKEICQFCFNKINKQSRKKIKDTKCPFCRTIIKKRERNNRLTTITDSSNRLITNSNNRLITNSNNRLITNSRVRIRSRYGINYNNHLNDYILGHTTQLIVKIFSILFILFILFLIILSIFSS